MTPHPDEQAREWVTKNGWHSHSGSYSENDVRLLTALLTRIRLDALWEAEQAFKDAYSEYEEPLIVWRRLAMALAAAHESGAPSGHEVCACNWRRIRLGLDVCPTHGPAAPSLHKEGTK